MRSRKVPAVEALVDILDREGVEVIFGVPGGPVLPLYDALHSHPRIRLVLTKHEQAAAYAAFAYARVSGNLGVCVATLGPGATNLLAGLPVAYVVGVPVLALTGQVQTTAWGRGAHQESTGWFRTPNQEAMFSPTCKHTATCVEPGRFPDYVRHSIRIARCGRPGPAHLIIPANLLHKAVEYRPLEPRQYRLLSDHACDESSLDAVAERLASAKKPVLFAGERCMAPDATAELQALAERHAIPVVTDLAAKSAIDEGSPMFLGCLGVLGHRAGDKYLKEESDLVLAVGQTFNEISTLGWDPAFAAGRSLCQLDCDPEEIGKAYPVELASVGHLPSLLARLAERLARRPMEPPDVRLRLVEDLRRRYPLFGGPETTSEKTPMPPPRVVAEMREALPEEALVLSDSSKWSRWLGRYFRAPRGAFVTAHDYEPMGWAVAGALGARFAAGDRPVVCVSGDGAFLMSALELATAANHRLDVVWLVMNDSRLGIIYDLQKGLYGGRVSCTTYTNPDFVQLAASCGIPGEKIVAPGELARGLKAAIERGGPALFDVRFDPDEIPPVRPRSLVITKNMGLPDPKPGPEVTRVMLKLLRER